MILGLLIIIAMMIILIYNNILEQRNQTKKICKTMMELIIKKTELTPILMGKAEAIGIKENNLFSEVLGTVEKVKIKLKKLTDENHCLFEEIENLNENMTKYNEKTKKNGKLKENESYQTTKNKLDIIREEIKDNIKEYNKNTERYNKYIKAFPNIIIANITGQKELPIYKNKNLLD